MNAAAAGERRPRGALALVLVGALAAATSGPLARVARPAHPMVVASGRVALAALLLFLLAPRTVLRDVRALSARHTRVVVFAGALLAAHFAFFLMGLDATSLSAAAALVSLEPLAVVLFAWALFGIAPRPLERVGVLLATVGAAVVSMGAGQGDHRLFGDALVVVAVVLFGAYVSAARALKDAISAHAYACVVYACAAAFLIPMTALFPAARATALEPHSLAAIAALAAVPTLIGHTAIQAASRVLSPSTVALISPGETLGTLAIGAVALAERPSPRELVGALVVVLGAAVAVRGAAPNRLETEPRTEA